MAKSFSDKFYHSKLWKATRMQVLHRDRYTCANCYGRANEVHHIIELTPDNIEDYNISINMNNLRSLCSRCHKQITKGYIGSVEDGYMFDEQGHVVPQ